MGVGGWGGSKIIGGWVEFVKQPLHENSTLIEAALQAEDMRRRRGRGGEEEEGRKRGIGRRRRLHWTHESMFLSPESSFKFL